MFTAANVANMTPGVVLAALSISNTFENSAAISSMLASAVDQSFFYSHSTNNINYYYNQSTDNSTRLFQLDVSIN